MVNHKKPQGIMAADPLTPDQVEEKEEFRSFTVRVPQSLYIRVGELAQKEGIFLNKKVNQLLLFGLGEQTKLDDVLMRLIKTRMAQDEINE